jgi:hypothetical protein
LRRHDPVELLVDVVAVRDAGERDDERESEARAAR